jgi:hypothetical protein
MTMLALYVHTDSALASTALLVVGFWGVAVPLITAAASAISSLWSGHKQADAAKEASAIQVAGSNAAQGQITNAYNNAQQVISPWVQTGQQANTTMANLMGFNSGSSPVPTSMPTSTPSTLGTLGTVGTAMAVPRSGAMQTEEWQAAHPDLVTQQHARLTQTYDTPTGAEPQAAARAQNASGYVQMQSPDGETQPVPSQFVNHYTRLGARVVG